MSDETTFTIQNNSYDVVFGRIVSFDLSYNSSYDITDVCFSIVSDPSYVEISLNQTTGALTYTHISGGN